MRAVVIYCSRTGFTKQYAQWIAEELKCECLPYEQLSKVDLKGCDAILFGSSLQAGVIRKLNEFKKKALGLNGKRKIVFAVGAMPNCDAVAEMFAKNFTEAERGEYELHYMQGGLSYERMGTMNRMMMRALRSMLTAKKQRTEEDEAMLQMISKSFDALDRRAIEPLVRSLKNG